MANRINFVDLYSFYNDMDCTLLASIMDGYSICYSIRTFGAPHVNADSNGYRERLVSVEQEKAENARKIIDEAIRNGVLSKEGKFRY